MRRNAARSCGPQKTSLVLKRRGGKKKGVHGGRVSSSMKKERIKGKARTSENTNIGEEKNGDKAREKRAQFLEGKGFMRG